MKLVDLELTAFADIAFLLIIFFILTTQFARFMGQTMTIPSAQKNEEENKDENKQITVNLSAADIRFSIGEEQKDISVTMQELRDHLLQQNFRALEPEKRVVILESGHDVPYSKYFKIVMLIKDAGGELMLMDSGGGGEG